MRPKNPNKKIDLLIMDIDDTFIYHRTVAAAHQLYLSLFYSLHNKRLDCSRIYTTGKSLFLISKTKLLEFYRFRYKKEILNKLFRLYLTAIRLHILNMIRKINNRFFRIKSSENLIRIWADTVAGLRIKVSEYQLSEKAVKESLNKGILSVYNSIREQNPKMKVLAVTEGFSTGKDPIKKILRIDFLESNRFTSEKGMITGSKITIKNKEDKRRIAEKYAKDYKNIGIIIDDYDDIGLLKLKNLRLIIYKKRLKKFIKKDTEKISFR